MKTLLLHPTGNANVRAASKGLYKLGLLGGFRTSIAAFRGNWLDRLSILPQFSELKRRSFAPELESITKMYPLYEFGRIIATKAGLKNLTRHEVGTFSVDKVYQMLDRHVSREITRQKIAISSVYAYEDGAASSFKAARALGIQCFYDLPIGYWRVAHRLMEREKEIWPEWAPTLTGTLNSKSKLARKDEELSLADRIFVASSFTANTLSDYPGKMPPVDVVPYGFPTAVQSRDYSDDFNSRPLRLLFVGGLSQRKGIANLFEAIKPLKSQLRLTVIGRKSTQDCPALDRALKEHTWIPSMSHSDVLKQMRMHDVLVFPSLFEGFGLVITEAMSQGTPVITTERTAGPDLITHGENGWIVEAGSTEALRAAIEDILNYPSKVSSAGFQAIQAARNRSWDDYGSDLGQIIKRHLNY